MTSHSELNSINAWLDHNEQEVVSKRIKVLMNIFQNCQRSPSDFAQIVDVYFKKIELRKDKDIMTLRELVIRVIGPQAFFYSSLFARLALLLLVGSSEQMQKRWRFLSRAKTIAMKNNVASANNELLMYLRQTYNNSLLWYYLTEIPGISTFDRMFLTIKVYEEYKAKAGSKITTMGQNKPDRTGPTANIWIPAMQQKLDEYYDYKSKSKDQEDQNISDFNFLLRFVHEIGCGSLTKFTQQLINKFNGALAHYSYQIEPIRNDKWWLKGLDVKLRKIKTSPSAAGNFESVDVTEDSSFFKNEANGNEKMVDGFFCVQVYHLVSKLMDESMGLKTNNATLFEQEARETNYRIRMEAKQAQLRAGFSCFQQCNVRSFAAIVESALIDVSLGQGCSASDPHVMNSISTLKACMIRSGNQGYQGLDKAIKDTLLLLKAAKQHLYDNEAGKPKEYEELVRRCLMISREKKMHPAAFQVGYSEDKAKFFLRDSHQRSRNTMMRRKRMVEFTNFYLEKLDPQSSSFSQSSSDMEEEEEEDSISVVDYMKKCDDQAVMSQK